jgi:hypothetical protein
MFRVVVRKYGLQMLLTPIVEKISTTNSRQRGINIDIVVKILITVTLTKENIDNDAN